MRGCHVKLLLPGCQSYYCLLLRSRAIPRTCLPLRGLIRIFSRVFPYLEGRRPILLLRVLLFLRGRLLWSSLELRPRRSCLLRGPRFLLANGRRIRSSCYRVRVPYRLATRWTCFWSRLSYLSLRYRRWVPRPIPLGSDGPMVCQCPVRSMLYELSFRVPSEGGTLT